MLRIRPRLLALVGLMLTMSLMLSLLGQPASPSHRLLPNPNVPASQTIQVGLHINNIYNLSLRDKTFTADGWYWLNWSQQVQDQLEREQIPVLEMVEFINQVERWDANIEPDSKEPERTNDGRYLQLFRFSGRFYDDQQNLSQFPFESLELPITIESRPNSFSMADQAIVLQPSTAGQEVLGDSVSLNGYSVNGVDVTEGVRQSSTAFGAQGDLAKQYSQVTYTVDYQTNTWSAFYTYVVPWLAVMTTLPLRDRLSMKGKLDSVVLTSTTCPAIGSIRPRHSAAVKSGPTRLNLASEPLMLP